MIFLPLLSHAGDTKNNAQQEKRTSPLTYIKITHRDPETNELSIREIYEYGLTVAWHTLRYPKFKAKQLQKDGTFTDVEDPWRCFWDLQTTYDSKKQKNRDLPEQSDTTSLSNGFQDRQTELQKRSNEPRLRDSEEWEKTSIYMQYRQAKEQAKRDEELIRLASLKVFGLKSKQE
jgi:hypothetical protein